MATTIAGLSLTIPRALAKSSDSSKFQTTNFPSLNNPWAPLRPATRFRGLSIRPVAAAPDSLSGKVEESIKNAQEACAGDPVSGECVAAWDEVEELSAAVSHAKDKQKDTDVLEVYCKDNPETDECRTYDN